MEGCRRLIRSYCSDPCEKEHGACVPGVVVEMGAVEPAGFANGLDTKN